ncbi:MAG: helicase-related protein, partial [bacterium]|nr:helicase-related protein [bacterium]
SCIYALGAPEEYEKVNRKIFKGMHLSRSELIRALVSIHYTRTTADLTPGMFRALGNVVEVEPASAREIYRIEIKGDLIERIQKVHPITRKLLEEVDALFIFPAKHFITPEEDRKRAIGTIKSELKERLKEFEKAGNILEAERLRRRTSYDLAMIREVGYCNGIENYSSHFDGRLPGEAAHTLLSYFPKGFLTVIDESHVTVPQIRGMYAGDKSRKDTLIEHGFRLPSARDNRPLQFHEFEERVGQVLFTSATPGPFELEKSCGGSAHSTDSGHHGCAVVEQVIRPTGLIDPQIVVRPVTGQNRETDPSTRAELGTGHGAKQDAKQTRTYNGQIPDFIEEAEKTIKEGGRVIATTLTKKMAEDLSAFLKEKGMKTEYLHSDILTLDRITILTNFRKGVFDCLVGVNLLREGLDLPEVALIGILDADREGFLRSTTSLIQIIGRAARNVLGRVILYADTQTASIEKAIGETNRRRTIQTEYNKKHGITPKTIIKNIRDITETLGLEHKEAVARLLAIDREALKHRTAAQIIAEKRRQMNGAVKILDFETAALLRDEMKELEKLSEIGKGKEASLGKEIGKRSDPYP